MFFSPIHSFYMMFFFQPQNYHSPGRAWGIRTGHLNGATLRYFARECLSQTRTALGIASSIGNFDWKIIEVNVGTMWEPCGTKGNHDLQPVHLDSSFGF